MLQKLLNIFGIFVLSVFVLAGDIFAQTISYNSLPANYQLYPRDETDNDSAVVAISGTVTDAAHTYTTIAVDIERDGVAWKQVSQALSYVGDVASFSLNPKIYADTVEFSFNVSFLTGSTPTQDAFVDNVVCGDVFIINGQTNAAAPDFGGFSSYQVEWVRSFGTSSPDSATVLNDTTWGLAQAATTSSHAAVGIWGLRLGKLIAQTYGIPVCFLMGARDFGAASITTLLRDDNNPASLVTNYGRLLYRAQKSNYTDKVKAIILWHGRTDADSFDPVKKYLTPFGTLYNEWHEDYSNLQKIYTTQLHVGWSDFADRFREVQRTIADSYADVEIMTPHNIGSLFPYESGNRGFFGPDGYENYADLIFRQVGRDFYGLIDVIDVNPPNIKKAYFTDSLKNVLALEFFDADSIIFKSDTTIGSNTFSLKDHFYFNNADTTTDTALVDSMFVLNNALNLKLKMGSNARSVNYLPGNFYNNSIVIYDGPYITNSKNVSALTFREFPIDSTFGDVNTSAPILAAITNQNMNEGETLDVGISSTDPDLDAITLTVDSLPSFGSLIDNGNGTGSLHFAPAFGDNGVYPDIKVIATDDGTPAMADTVLFTLTVNDINRAPVLTAITDQNMNEGDTLDVAVSSTDADGDNVTLTVNNLPSFGSVTDNGGGSWTIRFAADFSNSGSYPIEVIATDNGTPSPLADTVSFTLTVNDINRAPVLTAITDQNMNEGETLDVGVSATDADGNNISLAVNNLPSFGNVIDNGGGSWTIRFTAGFSNSGNYPNIEVIATDNGSPSLSDTSSFTLTVGDVNQAPVLTSIASQNMNENETLDVGVSSTDADGNNITLTVNNLPSFGNLTDNGDGTGTISFTTGFGDAGNYPNIEVIASDNGSPSLSDTVSFSLTVGDVNRAPVLTSIASQNMNENETLDVGVSSTDADGNNITLTANNLPSFGNLTDNGDGTGMLSFATGFADAGSYPNIEIVATDNGTPSLSDTATFTLTVNNVNRAPVLTAIASQNMNEGDTLDVGISYTEPDGDNLTFTINNLPAFGSFTDNGNGTGSLRFTSGFDDAGNYPNIEIIIADNGTPSLSDTASFTLVVNNVNRAPVLASISSQSMNEGDTLDVGVSSTDPDANSITLTANNLPAFGSFTDNGDGTGTVRFAAGFGDTGVYPNIEIIAADNGNPSLSDTVSFTLSVGDVNRAPVLDAIADQGMNEGDTLDVSVTSIDPDGDSVTLVANNLPSFGSFTDNGDGTGSFHFTPGFANAGDYLNVEVMATDNGTPSLSGTVSFTLTVNNINRTPSLTSIPDSLMNEGDTLNVAVTSTDPDGDNITLTVNNLPSFGTFSNNGDGTGSLRFAPGFDNAGVYSNLRVIAKDNGSPSLSDTVTFTLTVDNVNRSPVINPIANQDMSEGQILVVSVFANDLDGDNLTLTANNLPSFGSFTDNGNGTGSFRFDAGFGDTGSYPNIKAIATDDGNPSLSDTVSFTLSVGDVNRPPMVSPIAAQTVNEGETLNVGVSSSDPDLNNITLSMNNLPSFGSLTDNGDGTGTISFTPGFNVAGLYSNIEVVATDDGSPSLSDTVAFALTVNDRNGAPLAVDDVDITAEDTATTIDVLVNDSDPDGDALTVTGVTQGNNGTAVNSDSSVTYTPNSNFNGTDTLTYFISDGNGGTDSAMVIVTVSSVNDLPVISALPDSVVFDADSSVTLNVWNFVEDVENSDSLLTYQFSADPDSLNFDYNSTNGFLTISSLPNFVGEVTAMVVVTDLDGGEASNSLLVIVNTPPVGISDPFDLQIPQKFVLMQNYPNPFNPVTNIRFGLPVASDVVIEVYNILGQRVIKLLDERKPAGYHVVQFDASQFGSGLYFYRIQANQFNEIRKMLLVK